MKNLSKVLLTITLLVVFLMPQFVIYATDKQNDDYKNYSEAYKKYLELSDEEKSNIDVIPEKYDVPLDTIYENTTEVKEEAKLSNLFGLFAKKYRVANGAEELPEQFDLRDKINIYVRNQGNYGLCWDFTSIKCLETYLALHDYGEYDFSELHVDYLTSSEFGKVRELHGEGNFNEFINYYQSGYGPVLEEECPYYKEYSSDEFEELFDLMPKVYVLETKGFPSIDKINNSYSDEELKLFRDTIKKHIIENGSVYAFFNVEDEGDYKERNLYSTYGETLKNPHAMSVIGWDDNYSKYNFKDQNGNSPKHDGAYIVVNSWGESFNDKGFLYVSYDDYWIESSMEGITKATTDVNELNSITFKDENLYSALKEELGRKILNYNDNSRTIYVNDGYKKIEKLNLSNKNITDLSGIENFTGLNELNLSHNNISNIDKIIELTSKQPEDQLSLDKLDLSYNNIENISEKLNKHYRELDLSYNKIEDASNFCNLTSSGTLNLSGNPLKSGIQELFSRWSWGVILDNCELESTDFDVMNDYYGVISLRNNNITDASFLQNLNEGHIDLSGNVNLEYNTLPLNIEWLTLENNNISNLEVFKDYNGYILDLSDNPISDISIFGNSENHVNLQEFDLGNTNVTDISLLNGIERINLSGNKELTGLNNLTDVKELTIKNCDFTSIPDIGNNEIIENFDISNNKLEDISGISNYTTLKSLNMSNNNISNISALQELTNIEFLDLSNNKVVDISALANKNKLLRLDLSNNLIEDVSMYKDSNFYTRIDEGYINLSGNKIKDIEDVIQFWSYYESYIQFNEEAKEKHKINNQHYDIDAEFVVNAENNVAMPNLFINEYENRYKEALKNNGKATQIEAENCVIDHENNIIKITPSKLGQGTSSIKIVGGLYDGTTYTINYNAKNENELEYEIKVTEEGVIGYIEGENFNKAGTKVEKISQDGYFTKEIEGFTVENGTDLQIGQENVTIKYEDKETLLPITVYNPNEVKLLKFNDEGLYSFMTRVMFTSEYYASEIDKRVIVSNEEFEQINTAFFHEDTELVNDFTGLSQLQLKSIMLDCNGRDIESFTNEIAKIPNLEELTIYSFNNSKYISTISSLSNLKKIYINGSNIDEINNILEISKLENLEIHCNEAIDNIDEVSKKKMLPKFLREIKDKYPETTITAKEITPNEETEKQINIDSNGDYYIYLNNEVYFKDKIKITVSISGGIANGSEYTLFYIPTGNNDGIEYEVINEQKYITKLTTETNTVQDVLTIDNFPNENYTKQAKDIKGKVLGNDEKLGTGSTIEVLNNNDEIIETYKIVVKGDIDGTGTIDLYDILQLIDLVFDTDSTYQWEEYLKLAGKCAEESTTVNPDIYDILRLIEYHFDGVKW